MSNLTLDDDGSSDKLVEGGILIIKNKTYTSILKDWLTLFMDQVMIHLKRIT